MTDEKQGPAIYLTLKGKTSETILNLDIKEIKVKNGVENIVKALNKLHLKDNYKWPMRHMMLLKNSVDLKR